MVEYTQTYDVENGLKNSQFNEFLMCQYDIQEMIITAYCLDMTSDDNAQKVNYFFFSNIAHETSQ